MALAPDWGLYRNRHRGVERRGQLLHRRPIVVGGVDAANSLMAVKHLVYDEKKLTMAELTKALAANFEGDYEKVRTLCYEGAPKRGNDIPEMDRMTHRVYRAS